MRQSGSAPPSRFVCDAMLGRLARWLRLLGYDTEYGSESDDDSLLARASLEGRIILTRDVALAARGRDRVRLVRAAALEEQLREVLSAEEGVTPPPPFSRCSLCNVSLDRVAPEDLHGLVPEHVRLRQKVFSRCRGCGRVYWSGSHTLKMRGLLARCRFRGGRSCP